MATIQDYLDLIKNAIYGKDVRQAIHDGIQQCYYDGKAGSTDLEARQRLDSAEGSISSLRSRISTAENDIDALDSRVDQIVAPSGEAPSAAEVSDARVGADGTIYTNLGDAVRNQVSDLKSALLPLQEEVGTDIVSKKSTTHASFIYAEDLRTYIHAEKDWTVNILVVDNNNSGFHYYLYVKYEEDASAVGVGNVGVEGAVYSFDSAKTLEFIAIYAESLSSGTATINVTTNNNNGILKQMSDVESVIYNGYVLIPPKYNEGFSGAGAYVSNPKRLSTRMIEVKVGDEIYIRNGSLKHAVGAWNGTPSTATNIRNDGAFITADEKIISEVNGYYLIVFAKQDATQNILPSEFDGAVELYNSKVGRDSDNEDIPSYYFTNDYLSDKADRINELGESADDVFLFITDVHWELNAKHSPALINYLAKQCIIPRIFDGGDLANTVNKAALDAYKSAYDGRLYRVVGNHDWFTPENGKSLYYWYNSDNYDQIGSAFGHYWYVDNVQAKIRYITLNSFVHTGNNNNTGWTYGYDADQIAWFTNEALNVPDGYDVIVFDHWFRNKQGGYTGYDSIESAIASFNSNTSNHGKVLCIFQGHAHWDAIFHTSSGVPVITTTCDKYDISDEPELSAEVRTLGTINEHAFDVCIVNRDAQTITCVRIGALAMDNIDVGRIDDGFTFAQTLEERVISYA